MQTIERGRVAFAAALSGLRGLQCAVVGRGVAMDVAMVRLLADADIDVCHVVPDGCQHTGDAVVCADFFCQSSMAAALMGVDVVFSMAEFNPFEADGKSFDGMWALNFRAMRLLCQVAEDAGVRRFVHMSSIFCLGRQTTSQPVGETTPYLADDCRTDWERSLFRREMEVWQAAERGLNVSVVCAGVPISKDSDWVAGIRAALRAGQTWAPPCSLAFVAVSDLCRAMVCASAPSMLGVRVAAPGVNARFIDMMRDVARASAMDEEKIERLYEVTTKQIGYTLWARLTTIGEWHYVPKWLYHLQCRRDAYSSALLHSLTDLTLTPIAEALRQ